MADSDDEYDRKRRDKFRGERGSGGGGGGGGGGDNYRSDRRGDDRSRGREDWQDRGRGRPDYRDYQRGGGGGGGGGRFSPDRGGPPMKRMRTEWGDDGRPRYGGHDAYPAYGGGGGWGGHDHYPMHGGHGFGGGHPSAGMHPRGGGGNSGANSDAANNSDMQTQPPMLTLKQFLASQDDSISDSDAITKYNEYKQDFRRQQLNEFFVTHKDEEWFKIKYHPEESCKRKDEQQNFLKRRADVFAELLTNGTVTAVNVDTSQTEKLLRLLDTVVIKLEGGTDEDLKVLDEKPVEFKAMEAVYNKPVPLGAAAIAANSAIAARNAVSTIKDAPIIAQIVETEENWDEEDDQTTIKKITNPFARKPEETTPKVIHPVEMEENWDDEEDVMAVPSEISKDDIVPTRKTANPFARKPEEDWSTLPTNQVHPMPRNDVDEDEESGGEEKPPSTIESPQADEIKINDDDEAVPSDEIEQRKRSESASSSSSSSSDSDDEEKPDEDKNTSKESEEYEVPVPISNEEEKIDEENGDVKMIEIDGDNNDVDAVVMVVSQQDSENATPAEKIEEAQDNKKEEGEELEDGETTVEKKEDAVETIDLDKENDPKDDEPGLRALHKTSSIFLRNLAPTITKSEVEAMCKRYNGFLRVAIADPLVERRWFRRGWVTFQRDVNIKEICWNLNNIRLRDCELGAIVNRDLSRRVRPINGITAHKTIVRSDIKLCAKIAFNLDLKAGLWQSDENSKSENGSASFGLNSDNPVLQNITDYLIEEASAEEDELLGLSAGENKDTDGELLDRDPQLVTVLDKLILYLRVVHSVDFYNHCEYPYEDEMPNRCGIIHARGPAPQNKINQTEIQDYTRNFEGKMSSFLAKSQPIEDVELKKLGCKDTDAEVEKFVIANTQELAKDKWLCPLSGKKFKGPDFIRKHIFNKHGEKVDEVKKEVEYFNNYLGDPKRPQLPEHPGNTRKTPADMQPAPGYRAGFHSAAYGAYAGYAPPMIAPPRPRGGGFGGRRGPGGGGGGGGGEFRPIIHYRDLDAPREPDDFL